ncbi:GSCOCT00014304001.2-RA-CDS [Cotesia congregata]|uniref:Uncharacterized protein n=2 Tax=root TaxID=1 RepID=S6D4W0_COTCN|nr:EP1like3 [Bracoviriform congregatae]CAD6244243.1 GSCOCT00014304001.2-RA-CDS [Cotesia congregata]CAG17383.1 EP1like3 [Bracoviriform congregatae]CCQ71318.1 hypothetical protein EP1-like3 [Cotesia congregata]
MFGKLVVIVVLVTLVNNASLRAVEDESTLQNESTQLDEAGNPIVNNRNAPEAPPREIIQYLNCSDLHKYSLAEDTIQLSYSIILAASNPCIMKASVIILENNIFPGYGYAYNITGKRIVMVANEFKGPEQNHYIVGDNVLLVNNTYQGNLQVHEVAGYEVTAFYNVFDGKYRVHQYAATSILVFDNESKGNPFDVILTENPPNLTYGLYPNVLSNYETGAFNNVKLQTEYSLGKMSQETFDLTPMSVTRFLEEVKFGSKINRPVGATIVGKLQELIDNRISYDRYSSRDENGIY